MATQSTIDETVDKLSILQRSSLSDLELALVKQEWLVTFADVHDQDFIAAARQARLRKPFFPTEADIIAELRLMDDERKAKARQDALQNTQALPMGKPSQEYLDEVRRRVEAIQALVRANMSMKPRREGHA